jgi:hypothetical protein
MKVYDEAGNVLDVANIPDVGFVYFDPPRETRYHQIARVFDILSVLAALSATASRERVAYYWARRAAVKICTLLTASPPAATRARVQEIIRRFLATTGTSGDCGGNDPGNETAYATKYLGEVNDARTGKKFQAGMTDEQKAKADKLAQRAKEIFDKKIEAVKEAARQKVKEEFARRRRALADAEAAGVAQSPFEAVEDVGELDKAVIEGLNVESPVSEEDKRVAPEGLPLDEAVAALSEIVRQSQEEEGEHEEQKGLYLSPVEVIAEADNAPPMENAPPDIKRLRDLPVADEGAGEQAVEGSLDLSSPLTGVDYEVNSKGKAEPVVPPAGGGMKGGAAGTSAVALDIKIWDECPAADATNADAIKARIDAITAATRAVGGDPTKIIVYIGHPGAMQKQDIVKKDANYAPYALTYISAYDADSTLLKRAAKGLRWDRAPGQARLQRIDVDLSNLPKEQSVVKSIVVEFGPEIPCLLIPKFQKTVAVAGLKEGVNAMLDILKGLCIERDFVIDDLHIGNMAILNGKGVTFDYDRLCEKGPTYELFKGKLQEIHRFSEQYAGLPQFDHAFGVYNDIVKEPALIARYFCIYDLLSVLASLKIVCKAAGKEKVVDACELALKGDSGNTVEGRTAAVAALADGLKDVAWPVMTVVQAFDPQKRSREEPEEPGAGDAAAEGDGEVPNPKRRLGGGRRTFRRKGLPQLL